MALTTTLGVAVFVAGVQVRASLWALLDLAQRSMRYDVQVTLSSL